MDYGMCLYESSSYRYTIFTIFFLQIRETWTYILGALVTFGGIGNAIIYICNEGWYSRKYEIEAETTNLQVTNNFNINIEDGK